MSRYRAFLPFVVLILSGTGAIANGKKDILGLTPGMSAAVAADILKDKGWTKDCYPSGEPNGQTCVTPTGPITILMAESLPGLPLIVIYFDFRSGDTPENIVKSVSEQYGRTPAGTRQGSRGPAVVWELDDGLVLSLQHNSRLQIFDKRVADRNLEARKEKQLKANPTPKF